MSEATRNSRRRGGLGRGIESLIPSVQREERVADLSKPIDILLPPRKGESGVQRGGSQKDLLSPDKKQNRQTKGATKSTKAGFAQSSTVNAKAGSKIGSNGVVSQSANSRSSSVAANSSAAGETAFAVTADNSASLGVASTSVSVGSVVDSAVTGSTATGSAIVDSAVSESVEVADEILTAVPGATFGILDPRWIIPNMKQPRQVFAEEELQELADSIAEVGLLQPIVVRPIDFESRDAWPEEMQLAVSENSEARYELIMGERRWRASQRAKVTEIPAIVRRTEDDDLLRDALMENLHRVQLNPIEEASAYQQLMNDFACTQEVLAERVKRSRSQIANTLRLLKLPASLQRKVAANVLSAGHARALLSLKSEEQMEKLAARIIAEGLSVRTTEEIVQQLNGAAPKKERAQRKTFQVSEESASVARAVADKLDTEVTVVEGKGKSRLVITYADSSDLARIAGIIGIALN